LFDRYSTLDSRVVLLSLEPLSLPHRIPESSEPRLANSSLCVVFDGSDAGCIASDDSNVVTVSHSGLGVTSTSGILWRAESRLRLRWCRVRWLPVEDVTWATGGSRIPIDLHKNNI
jgi:hypothetical protein